MRALIIRRGQARESDDTFGYAPLIAACLGDAQTLRKQRARSNPVPFRDSDVAEIVEHARAQFGSKSFERGQALFVQLSRAHVIALRSSNVPQLVQAGRDTPCVAYGARHLKRAREELCRLGQIVMLDRQHRQAIQIACLGPLLAEFARQRQALIEQLLRLREVPACGRQLGGN
jgi:hypothetical protein